MTVSFIDVPGPLSNTYEPIDFTTTTNITSISVEFNFGTGSGSRETVYDGTDDSNLNGDFSFMYSDSTHTGSGPISWTVRRRYRWPAGPMRIRVKEGAVAAPVPALTPLHSPLAAWSLDSLQAGGMGNDRSGNSNTLSSIATPGIRPAPSFSRPAPAQSAVWPGQDGAYTAGCPALTLASLPGAMTCTAKFWMRPASFDGGPAQQQNIVLCDSAFGGSPYVLYLYLDASGALGYYDTNGGGVVSTMVAQPGVAYYASMQRAADNSVRLGLNGVYFSSGPRAAPPSVAGTSSMLLGASRAGGAFSYAWHGGLEDVVLTASRLSDTVVEADRIIAMGV